MAKYEQKDGQGSLFKNERKAHDTQPDYTGTLTLGGVQYRLAAWIKQGKNGKFMSLSVQPKEEKAQAVGNSPKAAVDDLDNDVPY